MYTGQDVGNNCIHSHVDSLAGSRKYVLCILCFWPTLIATSQHNEYIRRHSWHSVSCVTIVLYTGCCIGGWEFIWVKQLIIPPHKKASLYRLRQPVWFSQGSWVYWLHLHAEKTRELNTTLYYSSVDLWKASDLSTVRASAWLVVRKFISTPGQAVNRILKVQWYVQWCNC